MKKVSKKQASIHRRMRRVYAKLQQEREPFCTGCGCTGPLDHSHIISRAKRPDLQTDPRNITYHCRACHNEYEHGDKSLLLDYEKNLAYIQTVDPSYYMLLTSKKQAA